MNFLDLFFAPEPTDFVIYDEPVLPLQVPPSEAPPLAHDVDSDVAFGSQKITCYPCAGYGTRKCNMCSGTGTDPNSGRVWKQCFTCSGLGQNSCQNCSGRGYNTNS